MSVVRAPSSSDAAAAALATVPTDPDMHTVIVPEMGHYRVAAYDATIETNNSTTTGKLVVGIPLNKVDRTMIQLIGLEAVLSLIAIVVTVFAARTLVERTLRPLNRVAATAQQVSQLKLDRGKVALAVRVPPEDTNPASEVGRVGQAINHMLNNVEDALDRPPGERVEGPTVRRRRFPRAAQSVGRDPRLRRADQAER